MTQNVVSYLNVRETERANKMREAHNSAVHAESVRHNEALEQISQEQNRIQEAAHREQARHNLEAERAAHAQAFAASQQAAAAQRNSYTQQLVQQENARHNAMTELINREYNLGQLSVGQSNAAAAWRNALTNETALQISRDVNRIREAELAETARRNTQTYDLGIRSANRDQSRLFLEQNRNAWEEQQGWWRVGTGVADVAVDAAGEALRVRGTIAGAMLRALLQ